MGEKLDHSIKEKVKIKNSQMEQAEILGDHKKTKHMNHLHRRRNSGKGIENCRRKSLSLRKEIPRCKSHTEHQTDRTREGTPQIIG